MLPFKKMLKDLAGSRDKFDKHFRIHGLTQLSFSASVCLPTSSNASSNV